MANRKPAPRVGLLFTARQRDVGSLFIAVHLFCVVVALFGGESTSELSTRVRRVLGPYLRLVNLDAQVPGGFHWTHGLETEDDHRLQLVRSAPAAKSPPATTGARGDQSAGAAETVATWPSPTSWHDPLQFRFHRWLRLNRRVAELASAEGDEALAELAEAIGRSAFRAAVPLDARLQLQCRLLAPRELDPVAAGADRNVYVADIWTDQRGFVRVHKQIAAAEAAPVVDGPRQSAPTP